MRVCLIDDHAILRAGLKSLLKSHGLSVVGHFSRVSEAMAHLDKTPCDVVVLEVALAAETDLPITRQIRQRFPSLPLLILSTHNDEDRVLRAVENGANGYVVKSSSEEELLAAVQAVGRGGSYFDAQVSDHVLRGLRRNILEELSARERTLIGMLAQGLNNRDIARHLHLSVGAIKSRLAGLFTRFSVTSRTSLVSETIKKGLLLPPQTIRDAEPDPIR